MPRHKTASNVLLARANGIDASMIAGVACGHTSVYPTARAIITGIANSTQPNQGRGPTRGDTRRNAARSSPGPTAQSGNARHQTSQEKSMPRKNPSRIPSSAMRPQYATYVVTSRTTGAPIRLSRRGSYGCSAVAGSGFVGVMTVLRLPPPAIEYETHEGHHGQCRNPDAAPVHRSLTATLGQGWP